MARLTDDEIADITVRVPEWEVIEEEGMKRLRRTFSFENFAKALEFTDRVGALAEEADHHPRLVTEWGRVEVTFWSHYFGGMVAEDVQMAQKIDRL